MAFVGLLVWGLTLGLTSLPVLAQQVLTLRHAQAVTSDAPQFPVESSSQALTLPDHWARSRPNHSGAVWYRLRFDAGPLQVTTSNSVYIERVCADFELRLNGVTLRRIHARQESLADHCYAAQLIDLPEGLLQPIGNELDIKVAGYALPRVTNQLRAAGLSALHIGPRPELLTRQQFSNFWRQGLPVVLSAMLLSLAMFSGARALAAKRENHLGYLVGACLLTAVLNLRFLGSVPDLPRAWVEWGLASLTPPLVLCLVQFLLRQVQWQHRALDVALMLQCLLMPLTLWWAGPGHHNTLAQAWFVVLGAQVAAATGYHLWLSWRAQKRDFWPMAAILCCTLSLMALEFFSRYDGMPGPIGLGAVVMPVTLLLFGLQLTLQQARGRSQAEQERALLEQRMRETVAEIERNYAQLAETKVEQVTERERKRIAADLHDDLGAKLLTIVHTSESDRISTLAREALEEMRLSVRGLTGKPVQLLDALGDWRAEVVSRLGQANIVAEWRSPPEDIVHTLPARAYVQTTRIFRESVSNIIKHSGATHCTISCAVLGSDFQVMIQDNGRGISTDLEGRLDRGHGMASMKSRAKQMHGQCLVESGPGWGTVIRLTIPL